MALLAYGAGRMPGGRRIGLTAGFAVALMPSLVLWSATVLKEGITGTFIVVVIWALLRWRNPATRSWPLLVLIAAAVHVLTVVREHVGLALTVVIFLVLVSEWVRGLWRHRLSVALGTLTALLAVTSVAGYFLLRHAVGDLKPSQLLYRRVTLDLIPPPLELLDSFPPGFTRKGGTVGGIVVAVQPPGWTEQTTGMIIGYRSTREGAIASYIIALDRQHAVEVPVTTKPPYAPLRDIDEGVAVRLLVIGFAESLWAAILAPWVTGITSAAYVALAIDNLIWLSLLVMAIVALVRTRKVEILIPLALVACLVAAFAFIPGNAGNLMRQRASFTLAPLAIAASPILYQMVRARLSRGWPGSLPHFRAQPSLQN
jgi:4-amino-4-deoxy-L-arabinose transferase-like glycosyltransferase